MAIIKYFSALILLTVVSACGQKEDEERITFGVEIKKVDNVNSRIVMKFKSNDDIRFIFDWKSIFHFCPFSEDSSVLKRLAEEKFLLKNLKRSQMILENDLNEFVIYSDNHLADVNVEYPIETSNCFSDWYENIDLKAGRSTTLTSDPVSSFSLTISKLEKKRRFHYYFIPTKIQIKQGYYPVVITSNWF